jgi:hypothetical protein
MGENANPTPTLLVCMYVELSNNVGAGRGLDITEQGQYLVLTMTTHEA